MIRVVCSEFINFDNKNNIKGLLWNEYLFWFERNEKMKRVENMKGLVINIWYLGRRREERVE